MSDGPRFGLSRLRSFVAGRPVFSDVILTTGTSIAISFLGIFTGSVAARLLGPTGRGELASIQNTATIIATIATIGLLDAIIYFTARRPENDGVTLASAMALMLAASPLFVGVGYVTMPILLAAQKPPIISVSRLYLVAIVPLWMFLTAPTASLRGRNRLVIWNGLRVAPFAMWAATLLWFFFQQSADIGKLCRTYLVLLGGLVIPTILIAIRTLSGRLRVDTKTWRPMVAYGLPLMGAVLPQQLNLRLDQVLMAALLPARELGLYVVAVAWSAGVAIILNAISYPTFSRVAALDDPEARIALFAKLYRVSLVIAVVVAIVQIALTPIGIRLLFGSEFFESTRASVILVAAWSIAGLNLIFEQGLRGLGYPTAVLWAELVGLGATAIALAVLLLPFGLVGAAIASIAGYFVTTVVLFSILKKRTACRLVDFIRPRLSDFKSLMRKRDG